MGSGGCKGPCSLLGRGATPKIKARGGKPPPVPVLPAKFRPGPEHPLQPRPSQRGHPRASRGLQTRGTKGLLKSNLRAVIILSNNNNNKKIMIIIIKKLKSPAYAACPLESCVGKAAASIPLCPAAGPAASPRPKNRAGVSLQGRGLPKIPSRARPGGHLPGPRPVGLCPCPRGLPGAKLLGALRPAGLPLLPPRAGAGRFGEPRGSPPDDRMGGHRAGGPPPPSQTTGAAALRGRQQPPLPPRPPPLPPRPRPGWP